MISGYYEFNVCRYPNLPPQSNSPPHRTSKQIFGNSTTAFLDLACGRDAHNLTIYQRWLQARGLDINQPMLDLAKSRRCPECANSSYGNQVWFFEGTKTLWFESTCFYNSIPELHVAIIFCITQNLKKFAIQERNIKQLNNGGVHFWLQFSVWSLKPTIENQ